MAKKRKNRRKVSISSAVIRFLIGILLIAGIIYAGFYLLFEVDYTRHLINSDGTYASTRAYVLPADGSTVRPQITTQPTPETTSVPDATPETAEVTATAAAETTASPEPTAAPTAEPSVEPTPLIGISTLAPTVTPENTPEPETTAAPGPTATPVPTPVPTNSPVPTPEPEGTRIPDDFYSAYRDDLKTPRAYEGEGLSTGLTRCYLSRANYYQVMQLNGWGYYDLPEYDGLTATTYMLVTEAGEKKGRVYLCTNREGASRRIHNAEFAENVGAADFEVTIDASQFASGEYELRLILQYASEGKDIVFLCPFDTLRTFTVIDGEIIITPELD